MGMILLETSKAICSEVLSISKLSSGEKVMIETHVFEQVTSETPCLPVDLEC